MSLMITVATEGQTGIEREGGRARERERFYFYLVELKETHKHYTR